MLGLASHQPMSLSIYPSFFTVYLSKQGIELRSGYADYPGCQALHTCKSYESAQHFAQTAADHRNLPMRNQVNRNLLMRNQVIS